eukprot:CAMPEP_0172767626 /NCGR_PEP_ID=MMETSP1074-20121228/183258_1 /TAXON_ID=2916 /ORGANISM="Ceratium fusus, Strain PA161109" /LENGTH=162 /DNA_ID=CAMNT_0013602903 /DNA_START=48 /DNA_END=532 /DNA_ORIENTATION=-
MARLQQVRLLCAAAAALVWTGVPRLPFMPCRCSSVASNLYDQDISPSLFRCTDVDSKGRPDDSVSPLGIAALCGVIAAWTRRKSFIHHGPRASLTAMHALADKESPKLDQFRQICGTVYGVAGLLHLADFLGPNTFASTVGAPPFAELGVPLQLAALVWCGA